MTILCSHTLYSTWSYTVGFLNNIIIKQCAFVQMIYVPLDIPFSTQVSSKVTYNILPAGARPPKELWGKTLTWKKARMISQGWKMCSCYHNWTVRIPSGQVCWSQAWCLWIYNTEGSLTEGRNWRQMGQMIHYLIPHISMLYCLLFQRKSIWLEQMSQGEQNHCTRAICF